MLGMQSCVPYGSCLIADYCLRMMVATMLHKKVCAGEVAEV